GARRRSRRSARRRVPVPPRVPGPTRSSGVLGCARSRQAVTAPRSQMPCSPHRRGFIHQRPTAWGGCVRRGVTDGGQLPEVWGTLRQRRVDALVGRAPASPRWADGNLVRADGAAFVLAQPGSLQDALDRGVLAGAVLIDVGGASTDVPLHEAVLV